MYQALLQNDYGQYDDIISTLSPVLGPEGLEHLKSRIIALSQQPVSRPSAKERQVVGYGTGGPVYAD